MNSKNISSVLFRNLEALVINIHLKIKTEISLCLNVYYNL